MIPDPIQLHDLDLDEQAEAEAANWNAGQDALDILRLRLDTYDRCWWAVYGPTP